MREIQSSDAKIHLPQLLNAVERGETLIITRHGRPIARLSPEVDDRQAQVQCAVENIKAIRKRIKKISTPEVIASIHEGHRY